MDRHSAAVWWKAGNVDFTKDFARFGHHISFLHHVLSGQTVKSSRFPLFLRGSAGAHGAMPVCWKGSCLHKVFPCYITKYLLFCGIVDTIMHMLPSGSSQLPGGRHEGVAVEMLVPTLGSARRPVASAAAPGAVPAWARFL